MRPDFDKGAGVIPAIIQDATTYQVLMLGYMNKEAFDLTLAEKRVTFFSRSKQRLWPKGESSGNYLWVREIKLDCDNDTLLILVKRDGPVCHTGNISCFSSKENSKGFLYRLEEIIQDRVISNSSNSYTKKIFEKGLHRVAQKVGEEAVEVILAATKEGGEEFENEVADLLYHLLLLLNKREVSLEEIEAVLAMRHKARSV